MTEKPTRKQSNEIGAILDSMVLWERGEGVKRFGEYSMQRFWEKKESSLLITLDKDYYEVIEVS